MSAEVARMGVARYYLFTADQVSFYARLGWQPVEETEFRGERVTIMVFEIK